jgi:hypothetical protein
MHTFHLISKKIINLGNIDSISENNIFNFDNIYKISFFIYIQKEYTISSKYKLLNETTTNIFHTNEINEQFFNYFSKIQKTYHAFSRLAFIYKYKRAKIMIETDLFMNELKENDKYIYCLFQNNCKYLFNIRDLIKIIDNSIANTCHYFNNPIPIKNPYNNIVLNKSTLYNIYFFVRNKTLLYPELFYYFFKSNFNLNNFIKQHQNVLRNFSIKKNLKNSNNTTMCDNINCMIEEYNSFIKHRKYQIIIDDSFPKDLLIDIMKPYVELFLISQYSLIYSDRINAEKLLKHKLYKFNQFNPLFSRKTYKKNKISNSSLDVNKLLKFEYNKKHISFYESENIKDKHEFMTSHTDKLIECSDDDEDEDEADGDNERNGNNGNGNNGNGNNGNNNDDDNHHDNNDDDDDHDNDDNDMDIQ